MSSVSLKRISEELVLSISKKKVPSKNLSSSAKLTEKEFGSKLFTESVNLSKSSLSKGSLGKAIGVTFNKFSPVAKALYTDGKRTVANSIKEANKPFVGKYPELVERKYQAMSEGAFPFYRSTAYVYYTDIAAEKAINSKVKIPIQGDLHLENLGTFVNKEGKMSFGLNDFDDVFVGAYTWDLARLSTSVHLAAKEVGIGKEKAEELVKEFLEDYIKHMGKIAKNPELVNKKLNKDYISEAVEKTMNDVSKISKKDVLEEITKSGKFKFSEKIRPLDSKTKSNVKTAFQDYAQKNGHQISIKDVAFKIAGKGSLGRQRYIALVKDLKTNKNILLEMKEAGQPSSSVVLGELGGNQAQRVVDASNYFLPQADKYLGTAKVGKADFFVREVKPSNEKVDLSKLNKVSEMKDHLETVALSVAISHGRSGKAAEILEEAGSSKALNERIGDFSKDYAKKVAEDYKSFKKSL